MPMMRLTERAYPYVPETLVALGAGASAMASLRIWSSVREISVLLLNESSCFVRLETEEPLNLIGDRPDV